MLSIPPATMTPLWPSWMFWAASIIAFIPLAQTLLMVVASEVSGILSFFASLVSNSFFFFPFFFQDAPGTDTDLPGGRLPDTSLDDVAHVKLLDLLWLDTGPVDGVLDGDDTELRGGEGGEGAVLCADGSSGGGDDVHGVGLCVRVSVSE